MAEEDSKGGNPAPAAVPLPEGASFGGVPLTVIVKGGTTPGSYDKHVAELHADAEARRDHQDKLFRMPQGLTVGNEGGDAFAQAVRLYSMQMSSAQLSPKLVLHYRNRDKTIRQSCVSELIEVPSQTGLGIDRSFTMICPKCIFRGEKAGNSQMHIVSTHRRFYIDTKRAGTFEEVIYDWDEKENVLIAGTVSCDDIIKCSAFNCDYAVRIDESDVFEV